MKSKKTTSRRSFLKLAAGAGAGFTAAPWVFIPRKSFAAVTPAFGTAKRVLILYAGGGLRSAPLFNADVQMQHNPFGVAPSVAPGTQWGVGSILGTQPVTLFGFGDDPIDMPPVPQIANEIAILAGVDHEPTSAMSPTDHGASDMGLTGGDADSENGLLSIIHKDHPGYRNGSLALPPFDIGLSNFGRGMGDFSAYRPISIQSAEDFTGNSQGSGEAERAVWAMKARERRDAAFLARRAPHVRPYLTAARDAKIHSKDYAAALRNPGLDLLGAPEGLLGGVTNQQMLEVLNGGPFGQGQWGLETAFGLRALQMGVPVATVLRYLYDTHSDEKTMLPLDAGDLGRQIAGIHFLLKRMTDKDGLPMWNDTVVLVVSECSRDNTDPVTGFNSADGSDHQGTAAARNQCWPIFGGPITAGGRRIGALDPATLESVGGPAHSVRSVLATVLDLVGIPSANYWSDAPVAELFV